MNAVEFRSQSGEHYENDARQAKLFLALIALAAILAVVMLVWAVMV